MHGVDQSLLKQRLKPQLNRGRIAAWQANDSGGLDRRPIQLRQPVYRFRQKFLRAMRHLVPLFELSDILEPEVSGKIQDFHARLHQRRCHLHGYPMGCREEHHVALMQWSLFRNRKRKLHAATK